MKYSQLFVGRADTFAIANAQGRGYRPVHSRLTPRYLQRHLSGEAAIGIYLIRPQDQAVRVMAYDVDRDDEAMVQSVAEGVQSLIPDTAILLEKTGGRGWHVWIFLDDWLDAKLARAFMRRALSGIRLTYPVELYPKQDRIRGGGLGNLVRLPGGKHQRTGKAGQIFNSHLLPFDTEGPDPDLPITPVPMAVVQRLGQEQLDQEGSVSYPSEEPAPGTLPCIAKFQAGVGEGFRDEAMFRLGAYLRRQQIPKEAAWITLEQANERSTPPLTSVELHTKLASAYSGGGFGLPCSSALVGLDTQFCSPTCPVYATAKSRAGGGLTDSPGLGGRFPRIVDRDGAYIFQARYKEGIRESVISNFTVDVISRLEMPDVGADVLRVRIVAQTGREDILDLPVSAFASRTTLIAMLSRAEYAWYGTDAHCQYLKAHLTQKELPTQLAVTRVGRATIAEQEVWATPEGIITLNGVTKGDGDFTYHRPFHFGIVNVRIPAESFTLDRTKAVLRSLLDLNTMAVMVPILGWTFSIPFKPWLMKRLGHYPLLMLYGTRGSGKTQLVQRAILPLFGYSSKEPQIHFCDTTRYVLVSYGASTTTVPLFFDEYRPNAMPGTKLRQLWDHWRHLYAEDTDHRGQADLSRLEFKQSAPVVVAGEEWVADPAMQERMIQVALSPDYLTPEVQKRFRAIPPMEMTSRELIRFCLKLDPEPLMEHAVEGVAGIWEKEVSPRVYDNILVVAFGLEVWSKLTGRTITKTIRDNIFDIGTLVRGRQGIARTPLWADDFLLDVAGIVENRGPFTWGKMEEEKGSSILYINLRGAYAEWARDMRSRGDQAPGLSPVRRQLEEEALAQFVVGKAIQKRIMGANTRVYAVDITALREAIGE